MIFHLEYEQLLLLSLQFHLTDTILRYEVENNCILCIPRITLGCAEPEV